MRLMAILGLLIALGGAGTLAWNEYALARQLGAVAVARASLERAADGDGRVVHLVAEATRRRAGQGPVVRRHGRGAPARPHRRDLSVAGGARGHRATTRILRYDKMWSPVLIPSDRFEQRSFHANPPRLPICQRAAAGSGRRLAELELDPALVEALPAIRELRPDEAGPVAPAGLNFARGDDWLYSGDPGRPAIGDVRVRFADAPVGLVSVVAGPIGDQLVPFQCAGRRRAGAGGVRRRPGRDDAGRGRGRQLARGLGPARVRGAGDPAGHAVRHADAGQALRRPGRCSTSGMSAPC